MGPIEWVRIGCGIAGAALLLWLEWKRYARAMYDASEPWWGEGAHDEVGVRRREEG